ncbi:hypothetical protein C8R45DRAFT_1103593 [Mycena sanguinolenta]|nr:hypothetical protein C8R45DRAFT_1103593 [Mycena sanguinolenta]
MDDPMANHWLDDVPRATHDNDEESLDQEFDDALRQLYNPDIEQDTDITMEEDSAVSLVSGTQPNTQVVALHLPQANVPSVTPSAVQLPKDVDPSVSLNVPGAFQETQVILPSVTQNAPAVAGTSRSLDEDRGSTITERQALDVPRTQLPVGTSQRAVDDAMKERDLAQNEAKVQRNKAKQKQRELEMKEKELQTVRAEMVERQRQMDAQWTTTLSNADAHWNKAWAEKERQIAMATAEVERQKQEAAATAEKRKQEVEAEAEKRKQELETEAEKRKQELEADVEAQKVALAKHKADFDNKMAAFAARQIILNESPLPTTEPHFLTHPPELRTKVVTDGLRKQCNLEATDNALGHCIPHFIVEPGANTAGPSAGAPGPSQTNPLQPMTIDLNDPLLEQKLTPAVCKVLQAMGIKDITVTKTVRGRKPNKYTVAKKETKQMLTKSQNETWQRLAREFMIAATGYNHAKDFREYEPATDEEKEQCEEGQVSPRVDSKLYFGPGFLSCLWNAKILRKWAALAQEKQNADPNRWGVPSVDGNYMVALFRTTLTSCQAEWKRAQPLPGEAEKDTEARVVAWDKKRLDQAAWKRRKETKFKSRGAIIEKMIHIELQKERRMEFLRSRSDDAEMEGNADTEKISNLDVCRFLQELLERLGKAGMSSEETSTHEVMIGVARAYTTMHKVLISPWRNEKIRKYMEWIDTAGDSLELKSTARRPRVRVSVESPTEGAPLKLPRSLYNEDWLAGEEEFDEDVETTLEISSEDFAILEIASLDFHKSKGKGRAY